MTELLLYATVVLLLAAAAKFFLSLPAESGPGTQDRTAFFPVHCRYFPQMRQLFSREDAAFLAARSSPALLRRWKAERRHAARLYLKSLRDDFVALNRLARTLARHSARLDARQQAGVLWVNLRFQLLYQAAQAQIRLGLPAGAELQRIAWLVGNLGGQLEKAAFSLSTSPGTINL
jgi:hypothetical protein